MVTVDNHTLSHSYLLRIAESFRLSLSSSKLWLYLRAASPSSFLWFSLPVLALIWYWTQLSYGYLSSQYLSFSGYFHYEKWRLCWNYVLNAAPIKSNPVWDCTCFMIFYTVVCSQNWLLDNWAIFDIKKIIFGRCYVISMFPLGGGQKVCASFGRIRCCGLRQNNVAAVQECLCPVSSESVPFKILVKSPH